MAMTLWTYGFRPFFILGSLAAAYLAIYWGASFYTGNLPTGHFDPINWHAHEMIFGFVSAIIAGFLLTASANWTGTKPVSGNKLKVLVLLWLLGRVAFLLPLLNVGLSPWLIFCMDVLFLPALALALAPHLIQSRQLRNIQFVPVIAIMAAGNILTHLGTLEVIDYSLASRGIYLGLNLIVLIMVVIGGRVIPFFTQNVVKGEIKRWPMLERLVMVSVWFYVLFDFVEEGAGLAAWAALLAGVLNLARMAGWLTLRTKGVPLLWVLHLAYAWIGLGFILVFLSDVLSLLPRSVSIHAFTAGAMGTLIIGMLSRVSLGHTGRPLKLPKGFVLSYWLVSVGAAIRVGSGFVPEWYGQGILLSAVLWGAGFLLFVLYYFQILISPRADAR